MSQENLELVRRAYDAFARRDIGALEAVAQEHVAPHFEFRSIMTGQTYKGGEGLRALAADLWETLDYFGVPEEVIDAGAHVVVVLRISGRGARSGAPIAQQVAIVWTIEGGEFVSGRSFSSRTDALEAVGLR